MVLLLSAQGSAQIERHVDSDGVISFSNNSSRKKRSNAASKRSSSKISKLKQSSSTAQPLPYSNTLGTQSAARAAQFMPYIEEAATLYRLPKALILAVMKTESNFDPRATSPVGACGLMQLMPPTAAYMMVTDIYDPRQNILGGARFLRILANLFNGDLHLTAAAYNAGQGAVIRYGGIPPYKETIHYVKLVAERFERYQAL